MLLYYIWNVISLWNVLKASILYGKICLDDEDRNMMDASYRIGCLFLGYIFHLQAEGNMNNDEVFMCVAIAGIVRVTFAMRQHVKRNERCGRDVNPLLSKAFLVDSVFMVFQLLWLVLQISENTEALSDIDHGFGLFGGDEPVTTIRAINPNDL